VWVLRGSSRRMALHPRNPELIGGRQGIRKGVSVGEPDQETLDAAIGVLDEDERLICIRFLWCVVSHLHILIASTG
jgi:hypothetical protein